MSIQKKSLITNRAAAKKAIIAINSAPTGLSGSFASKVATGKVSTGKISTGKVSTGKISTGKVSTGKVSTGKHF